MSFPLWLSVGACGHTHMRVCICVGFNLCGEQNQTGMGGGDVGEKNRKVKPVQTPAPGMNPELLTVVS